LNWVHSFTAGIDNFIKEPAFVEADHIPLTNAKGSFGFSLAEFVLMCVMVETKHFRLLQHQQRNKIWKKHSMIHPGDKHMAIVGFGDIGTEIA